MEEEEEEDEDDDEAVDVLRGMIRKAGKDVEFVVTLYVLLI